MLIFFGWYHFTRMWRDSNTISKASLSCSFLVSSKGCVRSFTQLASRKFHASRGNTPGTARVWDRYPNNPIPKTSRLKYSNTRTSYPNKSLNPSPSLHWQTSMPSANQPPPLHHINWTSFVISYMIRFICITSTSKDRIWGEKAVFLCSIYP